MTRRTVGINLTWLVPGEVGGSEQSTVATLMGLIDLAAADIELRLFVVPDFVQAHPEVTDAVATVVAPISGRSRPRRVVLESTWLAEQTKGMDLVHHAGGTVPARRSAPCVLTLHDLQPLTGAGTGAGPATHSWTKRAYLARTVPAAVRAAGLVAVPSAFVRGTLLEQLGVADDRVVVVPHAVPVRPAPTPVRHLVARYGIDGPVVLYPAITYPHKDHATLLEAFDRLGRHHPEAVLVLPGGAGEAEAALQARLAGDPALAARVRRLGRVSDADLAGWLDLAAIVAVPSRYEGFGLPALEAMAAGVAVVAADSTALPEVVGDAGRLVPPGDVDAWATALGQLLASPVARDRLGGLGRRRAAAFSPAANAQGFAELYRRALAAG